MHPVFKGTGYYTAKFLGLIRRSVDLLQMIRGLRMHCNAYRIVNILSVGLAR